MGNRAESQDLIDLGNRIRKRRQEIHLSQEVLAEKTGISPNTISRIEGGQTAMSIEIFRKLAVILKTDAGTLLGECKEEENHRLYDLICRAKKLKRKEQKILEKTMEVLVRNCRNSTDMVGIFRNIPISDEVMESQCC